MASEKQGDPFAGRLRVRSCAIIVQDQKLLLVKQKAPTRPDPIWLPPGGGVQSGESAEEALKRELKEELNTETETGDLLFVHEFIEHPYHAIEFYFKAVITAGEPRLGTDPELDDANQQLIGFDFIPINKLGELPVYPEFLRNCTPERLISESTITFHKSYGQKGSRF